MTSRKKVNVAPTYLQLNLPTKKFIALLSHLSVIQASIVVVVAMTVFLIMLFTILMNLGFWMVKFVFQGIFIVVMDILKPI